MAKGQIHMGKNGPEKCSVDTSNPRSRGCPYAATGHYSTEAEAMDNYATLNRVDAKELASFVSDGASPKDAVGLIRSGYGSGYLEAARRDERVPDTKWKDATDEYLDAKQSVESELKEKFSNDVAVSVGDDSNDSSIIVESTTGKPRDRFRYAVKADDDSVSKLSVSSLSKGNAEMSESVHSYLAENVADSESSLGKNFGRMLGASKEMLSFEIASSR